MRDAGQVARRRAEVDPHPQGHSLAVVCRGKHHAFTLWEGAVRQHGAAQGVRYRLARWLADGQSQVVVSDASGEERIERVGPDGARVFDWDIGRAGALVAAPKGRRIAIANHPNEVLVGDLDSGALAVADRSDCGRSDDLAWSPDGAWLAYSFWTSPRHCAIKLFEVATGRSQLVTRPEFRDSAPAFDPSGRYLYFVSVRTFDPVYDNVQFELSFPRAARPYLIALRADGRSRRPQSRTALASALAGAGGESGRLRGARRLAAPASLPVGAYAGVARCLGLRRDALLRPAQHPLHLQHGHRRMGARQAHSLHAAHWQRRAVGVGLRLGGTPSQALLSVARRGPLPRRQSRHARRDRAEGGALRSRRPRRSRTFSCARAWPACRSGWTCASRACCSRCRRKGSRCATASR